ncbi:hypothetical protein Tco_1055201 [Tanacetum coccineum]|uniref:Uncharacterized protein n=1 Tax=Tanacetum coccineum TaxID=301880 RepID=A0ABQ5GZB1_9ASTR
MHQQSKDMHMRKPGEKPLIAPVETEVVAKPKAKQPKEDPIPAVPPPVVEKEKGQQKYKGIKRYNKPIEVDESKLMDIKTKKNNDDCYHASNVMLTY